VSSLIVWAAGSAPSKDTLWTTDNGKFAVPGCRWSPDHETPAAELHVVIALMTTGPVGISDLVGCVLTRVLRMHATDRIHPLDLFFWAPICFVRSAQRLFVPPAFSHLVALPSKGGKGHFPESPGFFQDLFFVWKSFGGNRGRPSILQCWQTTIKRSDLRHELQTRSKIESNQMHARARTTCLALLGTRTRPWRAG
jgi:hypothetical protein